MLYKACWSSFVICAFTTNGRSQKSWAPSWLRQMKNRRSEHKEYSLTSPSTDSWGSVRLSGGKGNIENSKKCTIKSYCLHNCKINLLHTPFRHYILYHTVGNVRGGGILQISRSLLSWFRLLCARMCMCTFMILIFASYTNSWKMLNLAHHEITDYTACMCDTCTHKLLRQQLNSYLEFMWS